MYYKVKALHEAGVDVHWHIFTEREPKGEPLEAIAESVTFYPRRKIFTHWFKRDPFIVATRRSDRLLENLNRDQAPILFEGLHTCDLLGHPDLRNRRKVVRMHNIEHVYYRHLARMQTNVLIRHYDISEANKLERFEQRLRHAHKIAAISSDEQTVLRDFFNNAELIPPFHGHTEVQSKTGRGDYILFHGNFRVRDNLMMAEFLIKRIFRKLELPLILAGSHATRHLRRLAARDDHIRIVVPNDQEEMETLIKNAQVNVLLTNIQAGIKLKLIHALYLGRFCVVNPAMITDEILSDLCQVAENEAQLIDQLQALYTREFSEADIRKRETIMGDYFRPAANAKKLQRMLLE